MSYSGVDAKVGLFALYPIIVGLMRKTNLPRRAIPVMLMSCYGIANGPGAVQSKQVLAMQLLGTSSTAGTIPGIIGMVIIMCISIPYTARFLIKCQEKRRDVHGCTKVICTFPTMVKTKLQISLLH
jgi:H+/gluconate symporter-like permease